MIRASSAGLTGLRSWPMEASWCASSSLPTLSMMRLDSPLTSTTPPAYLQSARRRMNSTPSMPGMWISRKMRSQAFLDEVSWSMASRALAWQSTCQ